MSIKLGQIITSPEQKDAIHIAIAPVKAGENLSPGQRVGPIFTNGEFGESDSSSIGIVDPFLTKRVKKGETFWLLLFPNTITSIRHEWAHPAFPNGFVQSNINHVSIEWLTRYAESIGFSYNEIVDAAKDYLKNGEYLCQGGRFEGWSVPDEFWEHFEKVTGIKGEGSFFTCSC